MKKIAPIILIMFIFVIPSCSNSKENKIKKALSDHVIIMIKKEGRVPPSCVLNKDGSWDLKIGEVNKDKNLYYVKGICAVSIGGQKGYSNFKAVLEENGFGEFTVRSLQEGV